MKALFINTDYYPKYGACSNILNNLLIGGKLVEKIGEVDVITVKESLFDLSYEKWNNISIFRLEIPYFINSLTLKKSIINKTYSTIKIILGKVMYRIWIVLYKNKYLYKGITTKFVNAFKNIDINSYDIIIGMSGNFNIIDALIKIKKMTLINKFIIYQVDPCLTKMTERKESFNDRKIFDSQSKTYRP